MAENPITELVNIDPTEAHLVRKRAAGFPILLAKAAWDTVEDVVKEETRSQRSRKPERKKMKKKEMRRLLEKAGYRPDGADPTRAEAIAGSIGAARVPSPGEAITTMKAAAEQAERTGDPVKAEGIRKEIFTLKMQLAERARAEGRLPRHSRMGPNTVELFKTTHSLPEDPTMGGI